jgi:hypothetical protein
MADDVLPFSMQWTVSKDEGGFIKFSQVVEVDSFNDPLYNHFVLNGLDQNNFQIELQNNLVGKVGGTGLFDQKIIAWEFRKVEEGFEGYEIYELQPSGSYRMKAEFLGGEEMRTFVEGEIKIVS